MLSHTWESLDPGSLIRVEYAAGSPRVNRAHDGRRKEGWWEWIILAAAGMLFAAVGAGIVYIARRQEAAADASRVIASVPGPHGMLDSSSQTPLQKRESSSKKNTNKSANRNARVIIPIALAAPLVVLILEKTNAPKAIYVALIVGFALAIPLVVFYLMAETGWSTLAKRFRQIAPSLVFCLWRLAKDKT